MKFETIENDLAHSFRGLVSYHATGECFCALRSFFGCRLLPTRFAELPTTLHAAVLGPA